LFFFFVCNFCLFIANGQKLLLIDIKHLVLA